MERLLEINGIVNEFVWGPPMLILLVGLGVYLTIRTKFFAVTKLGYVLKNTLMKIFKKEQKGEGDITAFQAVSTALAATVGTGNIAGVATAISLGGPGAIFWMWVSAIFGMTTKFAEVVLSIEYREKNDKGDFVGGPMYYISKGLKNKKWLAYAFAGFGALAAFGIGNMVQSNSVAEALNYSFGIPKIATGIILAVLAATVILGGIKRIGVVTERLVPFMAAFYILGALFIVISNIAHAGEALGLIFSSAFSPSAAVGGFAGSTEAMAMRRSLGNLRSIYGHDRHLYTDSTLNHDVWCMEQWCYWCSSHNSCIRHSYAIWWYHRISGNPSLCFLNDTRLGLLWREVHRIYSWNKIHTGIQTHIHSADRFRRSRRTGSALGSF